MRHPSEFWIRFLLSRRQHSFTEIAGLCEMAGLGGVTQEYLEQLQDELEAELPVPFKPRDRRHKASQACLRKQGIYEAWHRTRAMKDAIALLSDNQIRALVETFLLSPLKPHQIIVKVRQATGTELKEDTLDLFRRYYWNTTLLSMEEWTEFIHQRRVSHQEWLQLAVTARGPQGVQLLLWRTGTGALRHLDAGKIFTDLRNIAYVKAKELEFQPAGKDHSTALKNYVQAATSAQQEVTSSAAAMQDVLDSFQAFKMRTSEEKVPSIMELEGGFTEAEDVGGTDDKIKMDDY